MDIQEFRERLIDEISGRLPKDYFVTSCEMLKNNGVKLFGIIIKQNDKKIAPAIYIEGIFKDFKRHGDIKRAADDVMRQNDEHSLLEFDAGFYEKFDNVKDKIFVKLVSRDDNGEFLKTTPHRDFMDLSLVAYCDVSGICKFDASIVVKKEHISMWGVNECDVLDMAIDNTRRLGCSIKDVSDFLIKKNKSRVDSDNDDIGFYHKMYVMTNKNLFNGAICMTYDDRLDEFCNKYKCNIYIIPSSIHEVILIPDRGQYSSDVINSMIRDVNFYELSREEILSNHAYYYSVNDGYLCV